MTFNIFLMKCRIVMWVDADTVEVHPLVTPYGINLRIRLKDVWAPEWNEEGHDVALRKAKALLGDQGDYVLVTNTVHRHTQGRLEARVQQL